MEKSIIVSLLVALLLASVHFADAQQAKKVYRIGALHAAYAPNMPYVEGLKAGLKKTGLEDGRDVTFDTRFTKGNLQTLLAEAAALVDTGADLIFPVGEFATDAVKTVTQKIPIVFTGVGDPVASGIVREVAHPGANVTGVSGLDTDLASKRLEILKSLAPTLRRVWVVYPVDNPASTAIVRKVRETAVHLKLKVVDQPVRTTNEAVRALKMVRPGEGIMHPGTPALDIPAQILETSLSSRVPAIFPAAFWISYGALVSYGADYFDQGFQAARLVAKILRGSRPQDLPVEAPIRFDLVINLKTAKQIGLTIPPNVLARADKVIK